MGRFLASAVLIVGLAVAIMLVLRPDGDGGGSPSSGGGQQEQGSPAQSDVQPPGGDTAESTADELTVPDQPGGGVPIGEVDIRVEEGRTNGQRAFATEFVREVYGYTGSDQQEYRSIVEEYVVPQPFFDSAGGMMLEDLERAVSSRGGPAPASLAEYNITHGPALKSEVPVAEADAMGADLPAPALAEATLARMIYGVGEEGGARYFEQQVLIGPSPEDDGAAEARWQLLAVSAPERTEDPNADAPAPSAPKVMEPQGPGE